MEEKNIDRAINSAINIKNYGLNQINISTAGTVGIQACGVSSIVVTESVESATRYDTMKQETQLSKRSLAVG